MTRERFSTALLAEFFAGGVARLIRLLPEDLVGYLSSSNEGEANSRMLPSNARNADCRKLSRELAGKAQDITQHNISRMQKQAKSIRRDYLSLSKCAPDVCFLSLRASAAVPAPQPFWKHMGSVALCQPAGGSEFLYHR